MSPDERAIDRLIASAMRRARALLAAEAIGWGAAAAAIAFVLTRTSAVAPGTRVLVIGAAAVIAVVAAGLRRRRTLARSAIVDALERAEPASRNVIVTADEIGRGVLTTSAPTRARVFADAAAAAARIDLSRVVSRRPAAAAAVVALAAWTTTAADALRRPRLASVPQALARVPRTGGTASPRGLRVTITIHPPAYTAIAATTVTDPPEVQAIEGSELAITAATAAARVTIDHDGSVSAVPRGTDGTWTGRVRVAKTGYVLVSADRAQRMIPIVAVADALPEVRLTVPGRDLVYGGGNPLIAFDARATDDHGLRSLVLRYTKVSGSGENFNFHDGEIPLAVTRASPRDWSGRASRSIAALGLQEGDMLVYRAVAADARPGDGSGSSDAFFIEISKLGVAAGDAFTLPEEETRYALSQQMLIIKTERLQQGRGSMTPDAVSEAALNLAVEQRMIRAEFVFMLGGEIEDEDVEAEQSSELQEGRLQNRGQRDLRAATIAMSQAEKWLTAANTTEALAAERAAVTALQRAFARGRYILRALGTRSQLDLARRLTGNLAGASDWRRTLAPAPENRRAALLQDLVRGVADLSRNRASPAQPLLLAAEALRIDPSSASMRAAAAALQRVDSARGDARAVAAALSEAATAAVAESRRAHADPPGSTPAAATDLAGAFADALRTKR